MARSVTVRAANDNCPGPCAVVYIPKLSSEQVTALVDILSPIFDDRDYTAANDHGPLGGRATR